MNIWGVKGVLVTYMLKDSKFLKRVISSLVMIPAVLACVYYGGIYFQIFLALLIVLAVYEWWKMAFKVKYSTIVGLLGSLYIGVCLGAIYGLRAEDNGALLVFSLFALVWAGDTGAYFVGKFIGGAKMAPVFSPNKTWSGLIGGMIAGGIVFYYMVAVFLDFSNLWVFVFGAAMGIIGQAGDVAISAMKRFVGVKDTGNIIPGHGGVLDRIDALMPVSFFVFMAYQAVFGAM